jgi:Rieske Fe-S protein
MGCVVAWNALETCWDCPCHGSQFSAEGVVINGPATSDLAAVNDDDRPKHSTRGKAEMRDAPRH